MAATVELLEANGYDDLTLAAVAERANTTTAAIYRRWTSKADLVVQAVFRTQGPDVVADTGDAEADVRSMVGWTVDKMCRPAGFAALAGLLGESGSGRAAHRGAVHDVWGRVSDRLARAQRDGQIRSDVDPDVLVSLVSGPVVIAALSIGQGRIDADWVDALVSVLFDGIRPGGDDRPTRVRRER